MMGSSSTLPQGWSTLPPGWSTSAPQGDAPSAPPKPSMLQKATGAIGDVATGAGKGLLHTISGSDDWMRAHGPAFMTNSNMGFGPPANLEHVKQMATPQGTAQKIGYGGEQIGEFLAPGGLEERGAAKLATLAPKLGKYAAPLAHVLTSAISSGGVNAAQGGSPVTGALMGAGGQVLGQGLKAAAPVLAESSLGITKAMRGRGRDIGRAVLDDTSGLRPESVAESAKNKIASLYGERQGLLDQASVKPNPVRGLLSAPAQEIPLAPSPQPRNPRMRPMGFPAQVNPEEGFEPRSGNPMAPISEYPAINPHYLSGSEHPELSGRVTPLQNPQQVTTRMGVLIRPAESGTGPIPSTLPNSVASLRPARNVLSEAVGTARGMEAPTLHGQVSSMRDFLHTGAVSGEHIPENITPSRLGRLQQGFSDEHLTWNPNIHEKANAAGQRAYGAMTGELERVAPETVPLNSRISNLIPAQRAAESASRDPGIPQQIFRRVAAPTGALAGALGGGTLGYREGGIRGAGVGALTGLAAGPLMASPEGWMVLARTLNKANGLRPLVGGALQLDRKKGEQ